MEEKSEMIEFFSSLISFQNVHNQCEDESETLTKYTVNNIHFLVIKFLLFTVNFSSSMLSRIYPTHIHLFEYFD